MLFDGEMKQKGVLRLSHQRHCLFPLCGPDKKNDWGLVSWIN
jgi:hypothetical protein